MSNSKILVTGGTGFIGSHLCEFLVKKGLRVKAFDRYNPQNHAGWLENSPLKGEIEIVLGDIRDFDSVFKASEDCSTIFHLAALVGIPYSYISPLAYIETNIKGTYNVLESSKTNNIDQLLLTSTSETYGTARYVPMDEEHPFKGQSPYSASKISADQLAISYFLSFDLPVKIVRPFNNYGPRQSARAIIPTIISQVLAEKKEIGLGNTSPTRDFTYVEDTCDAILDISLNEKYFGEAVNIGTGSEITIFELVKKIALICGKEIKISEDKERVRKKGSEVERLLASTEKLKKETNWSPKHSLDEGLVKTIDWFKDNIHSVNPDSYNV